MHYIRIPTHKADSQQDEVEQQKRDLRQRWRGYNFPTQALLELLLQHYGVQATALACDAIDRQASTVAWRATREYSAEAL